MKQSILAVALLAATLSPAYAQNISGRPTYGTLNLSVGFTPDPQVVNVESGGRIDADRLGDGCNGFIANNPDVRVNYTAGSLPLVFTATADVDVTLAVNLPDGSWVCDDDGGDGTDARLTLSSPQSGRYDIWIGTYAAATNHDAQLLVSEISDSTSTDSSGGPDYGADPTFATLDLDAGFQPDPTVVQLQAGGRINAASSLGSGCVGNIARAPDVRVNYAAGRAGLPLVFRVEASSDTSLVINGPNGSWSCDDDGGEGLNPRVVFEQARSGQYDIWVGTVGGSDLRSATLTVSEIE